MWIFCGGMNRSGSTVQYQITARLVEEAKLGKRVEWVKFSDFPVLRDKYAHDNQWKVFKTHNCTNTIQAEFQQQNAMGVYIYRDVRDVFVSVMYRQATTFEQQWAKRGWKKWLHNYELWTHLPNMLILKYEDVVNDLPKEVRSIADHLGISLDDEKYEAIAEEHSLERQREYISKLKSESHKLLKRPNALFDPYTLLHTDHINFGKIGRWKDILTLQQVALIEQMAGEWLISNGYELSTLPKTYALPSLNTDTLATTVGMEDLAQPFTMKKNQIIAQQAIIHQIVAQLNANNNADALALLEKAIIAKPNISGLHYGKALVLARLGQTEKAIEILKHLLAIMPAHRSGHRLLDEMTFHNQDQIAFPLAIEKDGRLNQEKTITHDKNRARIKAIVLSKDEHLPFVQLLVRKYNYLWPNNPLSFRIPYNHKSNIPSELITVNNVELVETPVDIFSTMNNLLQGLSDEKWIYWCVADRYPVSISHLDKLTKITDDIQNNRLNYFDCIRLFRWKEELNIQNNPENKIMEGFLFLNVHEFGFWHHQFMKVKMLRNFLSLDEIDTTYNIRMLGKHLRERRNPSRQWQALLSTQRIIKFHEPLKNGKITLNALYCLKEEGIRTPPVAHINVTKCFTHHGITPTNPYWKNNKIIPEHLPTERKYPKNIPIIVCSFGGCGSKMLTNWIYQDTLNLNKRAAHLHWRFPALEGNQKQKVVYIFGEPRNSVVSFFQRKVHKHECHGFAANKNTKPKLGLAWLRKHIIGLEAEIPKEYKDTWTLFDLIDYQLDIFRLEEHFDNWFYRRLNYKIYFVKYEAILKNKALIAKHLQIDQNALPEFVPRAANYQNESEEIVAGLNRIYGDFAQRLQSLPSFFVLENGQMTVY